MIDEYKKGRLDVIKEVMEWISKELQDHPIGSGQDEHAKKVISGARKAHKKTFQMLLIKEKKTIQYEKHKKMR
jgi:hypothetical protein